MPIFLKTKDYLKMDIEKYLSMAKDKDQALSSLIWDLEVRLGRISTMVIHAKLKLDVSFEKLKKSGVNCSELDDNLNSITQFFEKETVEVTYSNKKAKKKFIENKNDYNSCREKYNLLTEQYDKVKNKLDEARAIQIKMKSEERSHHEESKVACRIPENKKINLQQNIYLEWVKNKATIDVELDRMMDEIKSKLL